MPSLDISFEMSNIGLDYLLNFYLNYSSFYSWIIKRLTEKKQNKYFWKYNSKICWKCLSISNDNIK